MDLKSKHLFPTFAFVKVHMNGKSDSSEVLMLVGVLIFNKQTI